MSNYLRILHLSCVLLLNVILCSNPTAATSTNCSAGEYYNYTINSCLPQPACPVGFGVSNGTCTNCFTIGQYNNINDTVTPCLPLTVCTTESLCISYASNGTTDNVCTQCTTTAPGAIVISPTQTEIEIWSIVLVLCFLLGVGWFVRFIIRRFQICRHPQEARIRELALSNPTFNRKAIVEASNFLENRLGAKWPKVATCLLREHPEQPIVEYINADMRGQSTTAKIECMLSKWKQIRGARRNLNHLIDCLYASWYTRLIYDLCGELSLAVSLSEYFDQASNHAAINLVEDDNDNLPGDRPSPRTSNGGPSSSYDGIYDVTSPTRLNPSADRDRRMGSIPTIEIADTERGEKHSVVTFPEHPANGSAPALLEPPPANTRAQRSRSSSTVTPAVSASVPPASTESQFAQPPPDASGRTLQPSPSPSVRRSSDTGTAPDHFV